MRLTYFGHSCFLLETSAGRLLLDPYLTDNPLAPVSANDVSCDYIVCSHGHDDHCGDALGISKRCGATVIAAYELAQFLAGRGAKIHPMNPGGGYDFPFGRVKLTLAHHSSGHIEDGHITYLGSPCGLLIRADGRALYHAGDTALFLDMQLIGREGLDAALLPIGDNFTMGPADAIEALDFLKPRVCIPMHYNTWPMIRQDAAKFATDAASRGHKVRVMKPGETTDI